MKMLRILAISLACALAASGCSARGGGSSSVIPPASSASPAPPSAAPPPSSSVPESVPSQPESAPEAPPSAAVNAEVADERVQAALKGDFSGISALDGEKKGWGPGGPTDKQGRPDGATVYQDRYGKYDAYFIAPNSSKVYLTFDEGYENGYTAPILDTLKEKNVKAVFFITMAYAKSEPELVKRMIDEGHVIGNHSTKHLSFPTMPLVEAAQDVLKLHDYVKANFGYEMTLFRPPMGEFSEQTLALLQMIGYKSIFWSFAYRDWLVDDQPLTVEALASVVGKTHPGEIMLLHAVSQTNAEILADVIDQIRAKGLEFARWEL